MLNRAQAFEEIARLRAQACGELPAAVLLVRVQRMRDVELSFGYDVADALAAHLERTVAEALRPGDTCLRVGESDLLVLLPALRGRAHAALAATKIVRALQVPFPAGDGDVHPLVVVGIAMCPEDGESPEQLCRRADRACDEAQRSIERIAFWSAPAVPLEAIQTALRGAIAENQLQLHLQPLTCLADGRIACYEALSRWTHPELGAVPPALFVDVAERSGQIGDLTRWTLNVGLRHLAELRQVDPGIRVAINLSVEVLQLPGFVDQVFDLMRLWNVPGTALELEVTESALMRDMAQCEQLLATLRAGGVRISIDDFGTGYSSLAYLHRLPVDTLKIDRSFIRDMEGEERAQRLVGTMIDLAHDLGLSVVAEGVEQPAALARLAELGCDFAQGFLIGRPAPAEMIVAGARAASGVEPPHTA
ncbi:putative bifunctional diguanylate cyclase/phosphodiesterase [Luteimonas deserti]|uniref:EAL domain-containing protein n=1 Tax=Luteimonas deserti TaxID=2752306 RepID=A0A7Z0TZZ1_9GAMM|nr:GGDEF domain-containing phosphodiesterase [Luteimonas deserti]NYZ62738.1 EAL domain-containing protein [Luteimonas deserti]